MQAELKRLIDEAEIRRLHLRYCRGVDRADWDLVRACYHQDATDDHGAYSGDVDGYLLWLPKALSKYESTTHFTGNQLVEIDGDVAWAEHYACVFHRLAATPDGPPVDIVGNVRYVDRLERRNGVWRILKRTVIGDADHISAVDKTWFGEALKRGVRGASDPSYAV
jgi:hypothetical protein